jgi:hypothetical protein
VVAGAGNALLVGGAGVVGLSVCWAASPQPPVAVARAVVGLATRVQRGPDAAVLPAKVEPVVRQASQTRLAQANPAQQATQRISSHRIAPHSTMKAQPWTPQTC